jgi:hypothetical protein
MRFLLATIVGLPSWTLVAGVRLYQIVLSPLLGQNCRFSPTCSAYFIRAVAKYGAVKGSFLGVWRIMRCNPFGGSGFDPP